MGFVGWRKTDPEGISYTTDDFYFNIVNYKWRYWSGSVWVDTPTGTHIHQQSDVTNLTTDLADKAPLSHTHVKANITDFAHSHIIADITGLQSALDGKALLSHTHSKDDISDTGQWLAAEIPDLPESKITNLVTDLAAKELTANKGIASGYAGLGANILVPVAQLGTGAADSTKFLRGDQTWAVPAGGGGTARESLVAQWSQSITKTNVGASFVDIYNQTNAVGKGVKTDFTGKTQFRLNVKWNKVGTGTQTVRLVDINNTANFYDLDVISGDNDSGLVNLLAWQTSVVHVKLQAKSTAAADDPIFEGATITLK